jgi:hypothetical protein
MVEANLLKNESMPNILQRLMRRAAPVVQKEKRNFDKVSWPWKEHANPFHIFCFSNGLGVLVFKHSVETFDGMTCYAIDDFTPDFKFHRATGLGVYDYAGGLDESGVKSFCETIRRLPKKINKTIDFNTNI